MEIKGKINNLESFEENIYKRIYQLEKEISTLEIAIKEYKQSLEKIEQLEIKKMI